MEKQMNAPQTVLIPVSTRGRGWAGEVLAYQKGKKPVLMFGRDVSAGIVRLSGLRAGDLVYRSSDDCDYGKEFCQIVRSLDGLTPERIGHGPKIVDAFNEIGARRQSLLDNETVWRDEIAAATVEKHCDLVRVYEIIGLFLHAGFYQQIPAPQMSGSGSFSAGSLARASETLLGFAQGYPEHSDFLRGVVGKLGEYRNVREQMAARALKRAR